MRAQDDPKFREAETESGSVPSQNIYDDPTFFAGYARLPRSVDGLDGAPEWSSLLEMLPDMADTSVLDLGCGFGWFCRWAVEAGARSVLGIDVSERMLERADATTSSADPIVYERHDLERPDALNLPAGGFDVAYSSLTLHYVVGLAALLRALHDALRPDGRIVFSVEHPVFTAPSEPGFIDDGNGSYRWPVDNYLAEGPRTTRWFADGVVKQHRTIGTYLRELRAAGFVLEDLVEWGPTPDQVAQHPEWSLEHHRPPFLLVSARRS